MRIDNSHAFFSKIAHTHAIHIGKATSNNDRPIAVS